MQEKEKDQNYNCNKCAFFNICCEGKSFVGKELCEKGYFAYLEKIEDKDTSADQVGRQ